MFFKKQKCVLDNTKPKAHTYQKQQDSFFLILYHKMSRMLTSYCMCHILGISIGFM